VHGRLEVETATTFANVVPKSGDKLLLSLHTIDVCNPGFSADKDLGTGLTPVNVKSGKHNRPQSEYAVDPRECESTSCCHQWQKIPIDMKNESTFLAADDLRTCVL
jgi:hypothetical protein